MGVREFFNNIEVRYGAILSIIISVILVLVIPGDIVQTKSAEISIAVIGILFGLLIGFFFSDLWTRWCTVRENVGVETSSILSYLSLARIYAKNNKEWFEAQKKYVVDYVKEYFKYEWDENAPTQDLMLSKINASLTNVKLKSSEEANTWQSMIGALLSINEAHDKNNILGKDKLSMEGWTALLILGLSLLLALFYLKTSDFSSMLFTALLTAATLTLFLIIRDLSNLTVGEEEVTFEPYLKIYDELGLPRYYWRPDVLAGRIVPRKDKKYILYD